jgi:NADH-quinone oxidoreductase subunit I
MTIKDPTTSEEPSTLEGEAKWRRTTFGSGLVKGLGITLRHLFSKSVTVQYPDEKDVLPPRSRGVIALKEENCTMCMLCGRECPDWCIYIEGHKERREPKEPGKRAKAFNVLDRFAIDYALCMYCGICVEVCPYDALFWSPFYEYAEYDIVELTHEMPRLNEWMYQVLPPLPLDEGAKGPEFKLPAPRAEPGADAPAVARSIADAIAAPTAPPVEKVAPVPPPPDAPPRAAAMPPPAAPAAAPGAPVAATGEDPAAARKRVYEEELAKGSDPRVAEARSKAAEMRARKALAAGAAAPTAAPAAAPAPAAPATAAAGPPVPEAPTEAAGEAAAPAAPVRIPTSAIDTLEELREHLILLNTLVPPEKVGAMTPEDAAIVRQKIHEDEIARGTEEKVAESLARLAEMVALQGFRRPDWK